MQKRTARTSSYPKRSARCGVSRFVEEALYKNIKRQGDQKRADNQRDKEIR